MNVDRIETLIKYMEKLPKKADDNFSMRWWFNASAKRMKANGFIRGRDDVLACGTTACALGWAATVPAFKKAGLEVFAARTDADKCARLGGLTNTVRGKAFFDLDEDQFDELFGTDVDADTPQEWAEHARSWLKAYIG